MVRGGMNSVFGPAPSEAEVERAMSDLHDYTSEGSRNQAEFGWIQQLSNGDVPRVLQSTRLGNAIEAFNLLHSTPSIQRAVRSVMTNPNVWHAVVSDIELRNLVGLPTTDERLREELDYATLIWRQILGITRAVQRFINIFFRLSTSRMEDGPGPSVPENTAENQLNVSFFISIVLLLIVVVTRARVL